MYFSLYSFVLNQNIYAELYDSCLTLSLQTSGSFLTLSLNGLLLLTTSKPALFSLVLKIKILQNLLNSAITKFIKKSMTSLKFNNGGSGHFFKLIFNYLWCFMSYYLKPLPLLLLIFVVCVSVFGSILNQRLLS